MEVIALALAIGLLLSSTTGIGALNAWWSRRTDKRTNKIVEAYPDETLEWKFQYKQALRELDKEFPTEEQRDTRVDNDPKNFGYGVGRTVSGSFNTLLAPGLSSLMNARSGVQDMQLGMQQNAYNQYNQLQNIASQGMLQGMLGNPQQQFNELQNIVKQQEQQTINIAVALGLHKKKDS